MIAAGLMSFGLTHCCRLMKSEPDMNAWYERLQEAPKGGYLAVDFLKVRHEGSCIEGVDRQFTNDGIVWGQRFTTSALVYVEGSDPYMLRDDPAPSERMVTKDYPYLTASEAMLSVTGDVLLSGYDRRESLWDDLKGVVTDAEFTTNGSARGTTRLTLRSLPHFPVGIVGRFRSNTKVMYRHQRLKAKELAEQFKPGKAHFYRKLGCYAKRVTVLLPEVGKLDLIFIWYLHDFGFKLSVLVSTIQAGVQELIRAFKARWGLEMRQSHYAHKRALSRIVQFDS